MGMKKSPKCTPPPPITKILDRALIPPIHVIVDEFSPLHQQSSAWDSLAWSSLSLEDVPPLSRVPLQYRRPGIVHLVHVNVNHTGPGLTRLQND